MNDHLACQQLEGQVCISINTFEIHKNVGLEQIDKTYKTPKPIQILKLDIWTKNLMKNTWFIEDIFTLEKSWFISQNQNLDFGERTINWGEWEILRHKIPYFFKTQSWPLTPQAL